LIVDAPLGRIVGQALRSVNGFSKLSKIFNILSLRDIGYPL